MSVGGIDVKRDPQGARARVAYLPENVALYPYLTGLENLRYFCTLAGLSLARDASRASDRPASVQKYRRFSSPVR